MRAPCVVRLESPVVVAMPKSVRWAWPFRSTSTLLGLTSRCTIPASWAASRAASRSRPIVTTAPGDSGPSVSRISCRLRAETCSITSQGLPPSSTTSYTVVTQGWTSRAAARASRIVRSRRMWRSSSLSSTEKVISFIATSRSRTRSVASQTVPMPPRPRTSVSA